MVGAVERRRHAGREVDVGDREVDDGRLAVVVGEADGLGQRELGVGEGVGEIDGRHAVGRAFEAAVKALRLGEVGGAGGSSDFEGRIGEGGRRGGARDERGEGSVGHGRLPRGSVERCRDSSPLATVESTGSDQLRPLIDWLIPRGCAGSGRTSGRARLRVLGVERDDEAGVRGAVEIEGARQALAHLALDGVRVDGR